MTRGNDGEGVRRSQPDPESEDILRSDDTSAVELIGSQNHDSPKRTWNVKGKRNCRQ
jgi:hypothetical protein